MIVVTGFQPFGGDSENPSQQSARRAVELLEDQGIPASFVDTPVEFIKGPETVLRHVADLEKKLGKPVDAVVCCGVAGNRTTLSLETTGVNIMNAPIPDNAGDKPIQQPIVFEDEVGAKLPTRLPIKTAIKDIKNAGIPVEFSDDAGTYVCNTLMYATLRRLPDSMPVGFIHVPRAKAVSIEDQARAIAVTAIHALKEGPPKNDNKTQRVAAESETTQVDQTWSARPARIS